MTEPAYDVFEASRREEKPTGTIIVDGERMPYWLPEGVTPAALGLKPFVTIPRPTIEPSRTYTLPGDRYTEGKRK